jgi:hypothetical protein
MAKKPMGFIFAGNVNKAQQEVASIIRHLTVKGFSPPQAAGF